MQWNAETEKSKSTSIKQIGKATYVLRVTCKQVQQNKLQFPRKCQETVITLRCISIIERHR